MEITKHGKKRVYDRTDMLPDDVLSLISNEFAVRLASAGTTSTYHLFYSPPDGDTKIAVVSGDGAVLITVWEKDYLLPRGVERVTPELEQKARTLFKETTQQHERRRLRGNIDVRIGPGTIYTHRCGEILFKGERTTASVSARLMPQMSLVAALVEEHRETSSNRITYLIRLYDPRTSYAIKPFVMLRHTDVMEQLLPAT